MIGDKIDMNTVRSCAFAIGDIVKLKSGGPPMTVTDLAYPGLADVAWFDGADAKIARLPFAALEACEKDK